MCNGVRFGLVDGRQRLLAADQVRRCHWLPLARLLPQLW